MQRRIKESNVNIFLVLLTFIFISCLNNNVVNQNDNLSLTEEEIKSLTLLKSPVVSKEEAQQILLNWVTDLQEEHQNSHGLSKKSANLSEIESIKTLLRFIPLYVSQHFTLKRNS